LSGDFNPAQRLHDLLSAAPTKGADQVKAISVFSKILHVPEDEGPLLLASISKMLSLPDNIRLAIQSIEGVDLELYLDWYEQAKNGVNEINLRGNWRSFMIYFPEGSMKSIEFCSNLLATHLPEKLVESGKIDELIVKIDELLDNPHESALRSEDWFFIHHHLLAIKDSLQGYRISGLAGIEDSYAQTIGALATHPETRTRIKDTAAWDKLCKIILATGWIVSTYGGSSQLIHDINRFLDVDESALASNRGLIEGSASGTEPRSEIETGLDSKIAEQPES